MKDYQWSAWERIEIEIKGNHVQPIVHNNKLYLFWLTFREKNIVGNATNINHKIATQGGIQKWFYHDKNVTNAESTTDPNAVYQRQLEISLNWIEHKDGKWKEQKTGKQKVYLGLNPYIHKLYRDMFNTLASPLPSGEITPQTLIRYATLTEFGTMGLVDFMISRIKFVATSFIEMVFLIQYPTIFRLDAWYYSDDATNMETIIWNNGDPWVYYNNWCGINHIAPYGTFFKDNGLVQWWDPGAATPDKRLYIDNLTKPSSSTYSYVDDTIVTPFAMFQRSTSARILNNGGPGNYGFFKLTPHSNAGPGMIDAGFFYRDDVNLFLARPVDTGVFPASSSPVSLASASADAARYYLPTGYSTIMSYGSDITMTSLYWGTKHFKFYFQTFYHPQSKDFIYKLNSGGIPGFLNLQTQYHPDDMNFVGQYQPTSIVFNQYPTNKVDFDFTGAYSIYNWELFFHMPLLIAKRLSDNQQFSEARKWYHYIFDPTCSTDLSGSVTTSKQRFWRFMPFYNEAGTTITTLDDLMYQINQANAAALTQVSLWQENPFKPHLIARMRVLSYMKNVVMCYLDNLIAWGDKLYRQDTIESINQATQLYILAANILGERPQEVPKRADTGPRTYNELAAIGLDAFSNALVAIEHYIDPNSGPLTTSGYWVPSSPGTKGYYVPPKAMKMFYYCVPPNPKLLGYWDTVANRLFNIRNCRNIDGQVRELPLFEPPIDPALLVRAAAAGIDASSVLDDLTTPPMPYKFTVMLQKANELCNDVKALGNALLSALEKKDAEAMALLRSTHEIAVLQAVRNVKKAAIDEAAANIDALAKSKDVAQVRYNYYSSRQYKSAREAQHLALLDASAAHQHTASILQSVGTFLSILPEINFQAPFAIGPSFGGRELNALFSGLSNIQAMKAAQKSHEASKAVTEAGYERRMDDWQFQAESASKELVQIDKQIIAAQIRKSVAEKDLAAHDVQIANANEMDDYMRSKYTNVQLYSWMVTQISATYFQSYQLAYDVARRAEKALTYELPLMDIPGTGFIKFGYWDSLKKGLLSGEKLQYDLRKMELAYLEANERELELTRHVSLAMLFPEQLLQLRDTGMCSFTTDRDVFNIDYPGHYLRRIKSVSISIPCVAGPYTTIAAMLTQSNSTIENKNIGDIISVPDSHAHIATSGAQNDSGMFELNFRDERYLPFEGQGAISTWHLSLMDEENLRQFDYNTISDVILHIKYTARFDSAREMIRKAEINESLNSIGSATPIDLPRYFSLRHEFANAWFAYSNAIAADTNARLNIKMESRQFPYFAQKKYISVKQWYMVLKNKTAIPNHEIEIDYAGASSPVTYAIPATAPYNLLVSLVPPAVINPGSDNQFQVRLKDTSISSGSQYVDLNDFVDDIYLVAIYNLTLTP